MTGYYTYPITYSRVEYDAIRFWADRGSVAAECLLALAYHPSRDATTIYVRESDAWVLAEALQNPDDTLLSGLASGTLTESLRTMIFEIV